MMLLDLALLGYFDALRVHGWIGDLALHIEHEFFGPDAFAPAEPEWLRRKARRAVEDHVRRLGEQLMPLLDRANRMLIRNLKAIKELRQGQVPAIANGRAEQVTVTHRTNARARPRPVKTERLQALSARVAVLRSAAFDTREGRQDALPTAMTSAPGGGGSPKRRARPDAAAS